MKKEGCEKIFQEKASGAQRDRPELKAALGYMRKGDTLVVWKIDRLARYHETADRDDRIVSEPRDRP